jgi:hypothetical protein
MKLLGRRSSVASTSPQVMSGQVYHCQQRASIFGNVVPTSAILWHAAALVTRKVYSDQPQANASLPGLLSTTNGKFYFIELVTRIKIPQIDMM